MHKFKLLHPLLISVYPIIFLYSINVGQISPVDLAILAMASFFCVSLGIAISHFFSKNLENSALLCTSFLLMFYTYGAFNEFVRTIVDKDSFLGAAFPFIWLFSFLIMSVAIFKTKNSKGFITAFLNVTSLTLVAMGLFGILSSPSYQVPKRHELQKAAVKVEAGEKKTDKPDIYYIILDGYGRNDVLKELYNHENASFTNFLRDKGFYLASKSHSNYCQTYLSLACSLNYSYLDDLEKIYSKTNSYEPLIKMIAENRVMRSLKTQGYTSIAFASGYSGTELRNADKYIVRDLIDRQFLNVLLNSTFLTAFKSSGFGLAKTQIEIHRNRINDVFAEIPEVAKNEAKPVIVFAHILSPHPPFVFAADGGHVPHGDSISLMDGSHWPGTKESYKQLYVDQLVYIASKTQTMINKLLSQKDRKKVIIIQSDHGPGSEVEWMKPEKSNMQERMSIQNAYYFDDSDYTSLYPEISPVNTFRVILNKYFSSEYELLDDRSYFSGWESRYQFLDVTDRLK